MVGMVSHHILSSILFGLKEWFVWFLFTFIWANNEKTCLSFSLSQTEVKILGQLHHPHLVKLIGYSYEKEHRLLVYEFMQLGSLDSLLFQRKFLNSYNKHSVSIFNLILKYGVWCHSPGAALPLSWVNRIKIALGAGKGLAFLHGAEKPVIYRDFKPSNILIDSVCT